MTGMEGDDPGGGNPNNQVIEVDDDMDSTLNNVNIDNTQQKVISERINKININNRFQEDNPGPYYIFVEHKYLNVGRIHPMKLNEILTQLGEDEKHVVELYPVGRNLIKLEISNANAANRIVENNFFEQNNLVAYVPLNLTEKKGIIRGVDTGYTEEQLMNLINSPIKVLKIERLYRKVKSKINENEMVRVPRQMIKVTFAKRELPQFVFFGKLRCTVDTYYSPVIQCFSCLLYGHTSTQCKSKKIRCKNCGKEKLDSTTPCVDCEISCFHCKSPAHSSLNRDCPIYNKQKRTKQCMAHLNITFKEAEKIVDNPSYASLVSKNRFTPLITSNTEFPELPKRIIQQAKTYTSTQTNSGDTQPTKKRKVINNREPHFEPIRRDYDWSYSGTPLPSQPPKSFEDMKNKIISELGVQVSTVFKALSASSPNIQSVFSDSSLHDKFGNLFSEVLQKYSLQDKS